MFLFFLKPYCGSAKYFVSSSLAVILSASILSRTLYHVFVSDIGRCCAGSFGLRASLGRSMMVASPISSGMVLLDHMCSIRLCVISIVALPPAFSTSTHMLSGPGALSFARLIMAFRTSVFVGAFVVA